MKSFLFILMLLTTGCSICSQKTCYKEASRQGFIDSVKKDASANPYLIYCYAGSDESYDYIYSCEPRMFVSPAYYDYFKMRIGILKFPLTRIMYPSVKRFDFNPVTEGNSITNPWFIDTGWHMSEIDTELDNLFTDK